MSRNERLRESNRDRLRRLPLFAQLADEALDQLAGLSRIQYFRKKEMLFGEGEPYRGMAVRLELSKNLDGWTERAGENPLRIERVTKGWIGNQTWKGQVPVIYYISPSEQEELHDRYGEARYLEGRGYFFKNYAYTKADGDLGRVPVFVMDTIEAVEIEVDGTPRQIMWAMLGAVLGMIGLLAFLLLRDRRKAAELQAELIRRRRARRGAASSSTGASSIIISSSRPLLITSFSSMIAGSWSDFITCFLYSS